MCKWNDECVYIDFLFRFSVATRRLRSWPIKLERQMYLAWFWREKKRKLLTSTANTHTMSMVMFDRSKVTKWTERFFTHCWLCFIVCSFCSFFLLLVPITFVLLMYTLLGIKIQSKPIAQVHLVHYSSASQYGRACMESGSGKGRDNEKIKFMYVICGPETLNIALT